MSYYTTLLTLFLWALPLQAVELRWNPDGIERLVYKAAAEIDITDKLGKLEAERWISDPTEFNKIISRLKRLPLKDEYMHYRTHLKRLDNGRAIRVQMIGVPVVFKGEAADEREEEQRKLIDFLAGDIRLQGDMDLSGDSADLTFYRWFKERNIMTQFFYLPKDDVAVGDHWRLPIKLVELGPGSFVQEAANHNRVTLTALKPSPAGTVAEVRYLVNDRIEGYGERLTNTERGRPPFGINFTVFGYGEFLVDKGHWLRQVTVIDYAGSGYAKMHKQHLFALELLEAEGD
jgi:hypothetical protein